MERKYECTIKTNTHTFKVNVFTSSRDKRIIKMLAIDRAKQLLDQFNMDYIESDIETVGFVDKGYWPEF